MRSALLLVILAVGPARAQSGRAAPDGVRPMQGLSKDLKKALLHIQREIGDTEFGRRLLAATGEIPVAERARRGGLPIEFVPGERPAFAVDRRRAKRLTEWGFEAYFIRARAEAASRITLPLVEAEMSYQQAVLQYALEKAAVRPDFAKSLRKKVRVARAELERRRELRRLAEQRGEDGDILFPGRRPADFLERLAFDLYVFSEDPYAFYGSVADTAGLPPEAVTLSEVEDFVERYGDRFDQIRIRGLGRYAIVEGRSYPARVARAAKRVRDRDGLRRLREGLALFQTVAQQELIRKVNGFLRESR
ncbi:MAG: hypothetical protein V3S11_02325 [Elusimicrobiota bacterium]